MERAAFSQVYEVQTQRGDQLNNLVLRATGDPTALASSVRAVLRQMNHDATIVSISTMEQLLSAQTASRRFQTWLVGTFSALALGLAALGVFAIMHYSVAVRTNEMGIRMALGAKPGNILLLISGEAARLVATGVVLGLIGAVWSAKAMASLLFQVKPIDPWSVAAAALTPLMLALVACYPPALRASRVDPMRALRDG
jgi:putative ABC transport system permease protein